MNIANSEGFKNSFVIDNNSNLNSNNEENIEQKTPFSKHLTNLIINQNLPYLFYLR